MESWVERVSEALGAPGSPQRTWEDNDFFQLLSPNSANKPTTPGDFFHQRSDPIPPEISCITWRNKRTSCGVPYRKPHPRLWLVLRTGNPGISPPFWRNVGFREPRPFASRINRDFRVNEGRLSLAVATRKQHNPVQKYRSIWCSMAVPCAPL
jgi:hypothetical protein